MMIKLSHKQMHISKLFSWGRKKERKKGKRKKEKKNVS